MVTGSDGLGDRYPRLGPRQGSLGLVIVGVGRDCGLGRFEVGLRSSDVDLIGCICSVAQDRDHVVADFDEATVEGCRVPR